MDTTPLGRHLEWKSFPSARLVFLQGSASELSGPKLRFLHVAPRNLEFVYF